MHRLMLLVGMATALVAANGCAPRPGTPLAAAAADNDAAAVRRLLASGEPPDDRGPADDPASGTADHNLTPLMWAARHGALDAMAALLDAGADINAQDRRYGWTALQHAIHVRQRAAVARLLERGADPNRSFVPGSLTPLLMAVDDPDPTMVNLLLAHGADPTVRGEFGATPLSSAVGGGDRPLAGGCRPAIVRALLEHDPDVGMPDTLAGLEARLVARFHHCAEVLAMIGDPDPRHDEPRQKK